MVAYGIWSLWTLPLRQQLWNSPCLTAAMKTVIRETFMKELTEL